MLLGAYEQACRPWAPRTTPADFTMMLLEDDLDRITPSLERGAKHFPPFGRVGIRKIINGPFTFAPDGNPSGGSGAGLAELLGGVWCDGGLQPGRRRRFGAVALDR